MKRFVTILLVLAMLASMGSIVYAEDFGIGEGSFSNSGDSVSANVYGYFEAAQAPATVYSVTVEWDSLEYSCEVIGTATWRPSIHDYNNQLSFKWNTPSLDLLNPDIKLPQYNRTVRVTNNSNSDVHVQANAAVQEQNYGFGLSVSPRSATMHNLADTDENNMQDFKVTLLPADEPDIDMPEQFQVGTVTITIQAVSP